MSIRASAVTTGRETATPDLAMAGFGVPYLAVGQQTPCTTYWDLFEAVADVTSAALHAEHAEALTEVRQLCATCPTQRECGDYGVDTRQRAGIWGGMSIYEIDRRIRRETRAARAAS